MSEGTEQHPEMLFIVLDEPGFINDVLAALLEAGVTNATVIESQGMGRLLSRDMPIFASFRHLFAGSKPYTYTIFAPVEGPEVTSEATALISDVFGDAPEEDRGILFAVPLRTFVHL